LHMQAAAETRMNFCFDFPECDVVLAEATIFPTRGGKPRSSDDPGEDVNNAQCTITSSTHRNRRKQGKPQTRNRRTVSLTNECMHHLLLPKKK